MNDKAPARSPASLLRPNPRAKQQEIIQGLRGRIVHGLLKPGSRLPTYVELASEYDTSPVTIQRALDRLHFEGWIIPQARQGTFVADRPPHLCNFGLVFGSPTGGHKSRFHESMMRDALRFNRQAEDRQFVLYNGINPELETEAYKQFVDDVLGHRLAGLVLAEPYITARCPAIAEARMPMVGFHDLQFNKEGVPGIGNDQQLEARMAIDWLLGQGRRRLAILTLVQQNMPVFEPMLQHAASLGAICRPEWVLTGHQDYLWWMRNTIRAMFAGPEKPDALYITDDHLVESATSALAELGLRVPEDLHIVGHANFPDVTPSVLPIRRLGCDVRVLMRKAMDLIEAQRANLPVPPLTLLTPVFDADLNTSPSY